MDSRTAALITGANGGIGRALCSAFRDAGHFVVATDLQSAAVDLACHEYVCCDLRQAARNDETRLRLISAVARYCETRQLKVLVNNAAVQRLGPFGSLQAEDWRMTLDVNVLAPALLAHDLLPLLERSSGVVINIASIHARLTKPTFSAYATSKAALIGLTQAMAVDLGGKVRVNAIAPAAIGTEMLTAGFAHDPPALKSLAQSHPAGRIGQPGEVAAAALFLASDACSFMTGAVLDIDGGIGHRLHDPL